MNHIPTFVKSFLNKYRTWTPDERKQFRSEINDEALWNDAPIILINKNYIELCNCHYKTEILADILSDKINKLKEVFRQYDEFAKKND